MAIDNYSGRLIQLTDPGLRATAITPSDAVELVEIPKAIYVGGAGNITMRGFGDSVDVVWTAVPVGTILPFRPQYIRATGTTATALVAIY